jgi:ubiquinol-cytochrome c reductase cytochrome c1 subunit
MMRAAWLRPSPHASVGASSGAPSGASVGASLRSARRLLAVAALACAAGGVLPIHAAHAQAEATPPPKENWSFTGPFGAFDLAAVQRGFGVYLNVCSNCHSMTLLHYRDLSGIGLTPAQIKAVAASVQVPTGEEDDQGQPIMGPGTPASQFRSPFPNEKAARAALNGALPPDLSLIYNAREGHGNYIYGILNGYKTPPAGVTMSAGMYYNEYFPGHQIAMPPPLTADRVTYADGTKATLDQEAHDITTFLAFTANPHLDERHQIGVKMVLFLVILTGLVYALKRKIWAAVH